MRREYAIDARDDCLGMASDDLRTLLAGLMMIATLIHDEAVKRHDVEMIARRVALSSLSL